MNNVFLGYFGLPETSQASLCVSETDLFLFESYILFGDDDFSGVVQLEDAPRTGTIENFILGRITTVSANVQEGNKERLGLQILLTIKMLHEILSEYFFL